VAGLDVIKRREKSLTRPGIEPGLTRSLVTVL